MRINDLYVAGAITIQNGFPCGNWNDEGRGIPQLRPFNVTDGGQIDLSTVKYIETDQRLGAYLLRPNDVVFNNTNSEDLVGKTALWVKPERAVLSNHMTIVRVLDESAADASFLAMYLLHKWYEGHFKTVCRRHVNQASVSRERLCDVAFPTVSVDEQRQIAAALSAVHRAIERQERLIALTVELKKALMYKLFTEGARGEPLKQTEIGPVPESWVVESLGEHLVVAQYGLSVKGADDGATPILRMTNQVDGRIVARDLQMVNISEADRLKFKVEPQDILFNRTNSFELVGRTAIFDLEGDFVFASYLIRLRTQANKLRPAFLNHYFNWSAVQARLKGIASRAVSQSNISASRLRGFLVLLPSPEEQDEIVSCIDQIDRVRSVQQRQLGVLQGLFRTLLHQLMTAKIRVNELDLSALEEAAEPVGAA